MRARIDDAFGKNRPIVIRNLGEDEAGRASAFVAANGAVLDPSRRAVRVGDDQLRPTMMANPHMSLRLAHLASRPTQQILTQ